MFKNGDEEEIVLAQDGWNVVLVGEEVLFTDTKRGYALRLNFTGNIKDDSGKYNLWVNEVAYDSLDLAAEEEDVVYSR